MIFQTGNESLFDAFNRVRVSEPATLFSASNEYAIALNAWNTKESGGTVAFQTNESSVLLSATTPDEITGSTISTVNVSLGIDFSIVPVSFIVDETEITLNTTYETQAALVSAIDAQLPATCTVAASTDYLEFTTTDVGPSSSFTLIEGEGSGLAALGLTAGTITGTYDTANTAILQSKTYARYQPGKSTMILITANFHTMEEGVTKRAGYFDANNGIYFMNDGTRNAFVIRTKTSGSVVENIVYQESWNVDAYDGTGRSGATFDISKAQIIFFDLEWLGVGQVRCGFVLDGFVYYMHFFSHANSTVLPYMQTGSLPIRYEISNASGSASNLRAICASVSSEGGQQFPLGEPFSVASTLKSVSSTAIPLLSIRKALLYKSMPNRIQIELDDVIAYSDDAPILVKVIHNPTLTGASFSSVHTNSAVEYDTSATAYTGGNVVKQFFVTAVGRNEASVSTASVYEKIILELDIDDTVSDIISLVAIKVNGSDTEVIGAINWKEIY